MSNQQRGQAGGYKVIELISGIDDDKLLNARRCHTGVGYVVYIKDKGYRIYPLSGSTKLTLGHVYDDSTSTKKFRVMEVLQPT